MIGRLLMMATGLITMLWRRNRAKGSAPVPKTVWPPGSGYVVEMFSRWTHKWFPAIVDRSVPSAEGGWPCLAVRTVRSCSYVGENHVLEHELRPLDWLASARRDSDRFRETRPVWDVFDTHAIEHMDGCPGCPECEGLDEYYPACPDCGRRHHLTAVDCICGMYPYLRNGSEAKARMAMAWWRKNPPAPPPS